MEQGSRVADTIQAAGGATEGALLHCVNPATAVRDEDHYHVPGGDEPCAVPTTPGTVSEAPNDARIDLNTAFREQLDSLPNIGPILADAIIEYRQAHGPFNTVDDILEVPRIGPKTLEGIRDLVRVSVASP